MNWVRHSSRTTFETGLIGTQYCTSIIKLEVRDCFSLSFFPYMQLISRNMHCVTRRTIRVPGHISDSFKGRDIAQKAPLLSAVLSNDRGKLK